MLGSDEYDGNYQTPEEVVTTALRSLDRGNRQPSVTSGRVNSIATSAVRLLTRKRAVLIAASAAESSMKSAG